MKNTTLNQLKPRELGTVTGLLHTTEMNRRLSDLGLIDGTEVECLYSSPWGSPTAYLIRGAVIALRTADSKRIEIITP